MGTIDYYQDAELEIKEKRYVPLFPHLYTFKKDPDAKEVPIDVKCKEEATALMSGGKSFENLSDGHPIR